MFTRDQILKISPAVLIIMYILCVLSICGCLCLAALSVRYRNEPVLKAASWRINQIMLVGGVLALIAMIIYGIDEQSVSSEQVFAWKWLCNCRLWLWIISYTLL